MIKFENVVAGQKNAAFRKMLEQALPGVEIECLYFPDNRLVIETDWENVFPAIPQEILLAHAGLKFELIFNNETPIKCLSFEYYLNALDNALVRGVFSIKEEHWFQYLRYEMTNFRTLRLEIRTRNPEATDAELLEMLELLNKLDITSRMQQLFERLQGVENK